MSAADSHATERTGPGTLCLTFDVDAESVMLAQDPLHERRASLVSHQRYGPKVGVPRILDVLGRLEVRATFFVPGQQLSAIPTRSRRSSRRATRWAITATSTSPSSACAVMSLGEVLQLHEESSTEGWRGQPNNREG